MRFWNSALCVLEPTVHGNSVTSRLATVRCPAQLVPVVLSASPSIRHFSRIPHNNSAFCGHFGPSMKSGKPPARRPRANAECQPELFKILAAFFTTPKKLPKYGPKLDKEALSDSAELLLQGWMSVLVRAVHPAVPAAE